MTWDPPAEVEEYRIVRPLGRGAMGQVYLAHDALLDRAVAIKFVGAAEVGPSERDRFFTEARAIARLSHPNVVAIHRVGEVRRRPYLVSEYVRGTPLDKVSRPLAWERALDLGLQLARGLAAAHRRGVLHRDIKPANVVVGDDGEAKLLDFGLAKLVDVAAPAPPAVASATRDVAVDETISIVGRPATPTAIPATPQVAEASQLVGTPLYLAPELWRGQAASPRSDVYALGLLLYEMVAGKPPHAGLRFAELQDRVQDGAPPVASCADVPARFAEVIDACVARDPDARPASGDAVCELLEAVREQPVVIDGNPYRGLATFDREHRAVFFGRATEIRQVVERLRDEAIVVVAGDSGAGKSSLCRAGVIPALADAGWRVHTIVPGPRPLAALAAVAPGDGDTLVFVDQLEELLTVADEDEAGLVAERLVELATGRVRVVATARADFLGRLAALPGLGDVLARALLLLGPLGSRGLRDAIVGPARALGYAFESDATVDELVASGRRNLPLMQFALAELWDVRDDAGKTIPADALAKIGGVTGALARHADHVMAGLGDDRELAWRLMTALMTAEGTRAIRTREELSALGNAEPVIERLVRARLLAIADDRVEVVHEALFTGWPRLVAWRRAHDADARLRDQVAEAAKQWDARGRPRGLLWRDDALAEYRAWRRRWREPATPVEAAFGAASESEARRTRRIRGLAIGAIVAGLALGLVVLYRARATAERQNRTLQGEQALHEIASEHATRAMPYLVELLREGDDTPANRFMVAEGMRPIDSHIATIAETQQGMNQLVMSRAGDRLAAVDYTGAVGIYDAHGKRTRSLPIPIGGATAAFTAGDTQLATMSTNHMIQLWDVATGRLVNAWPYVGEAASLVGGGPRVAVWMADRSVVVYDTASGAVVGREPSTHGDVITLALSSDGTQLAVAYADGVVARIDTLSLATTSELHVDGAPRSLAFAHGDNRLAVTTGARQLRIYDGDALTITTATGQLEGGVTWSSDDTRVATFGVASSTKIWDARTGSLVLDVGTRAGLVHLDAHGDVVAVTGTDNLTRVVDVASGEVRNAVETEVSGGRGKGARPGVIDIQLSPDGTRLYTMSATRVDMWHADQSTLLATFPVLGANSIGVSPDHRLTAFGGDRGAIEVHDVATGALVRRAEAGDALVFDVGISPDDRRLVAATRGAGASIIDADGTRHDLQTGIVYRATWSPDGTRVLTAGEDAFARVWDARTGTLVLAIAGHTDKVMCAAWSPDGTHIATAGKDQTVRIWNATTGAAVARFDTPNTQFLDVSWSPDGTQLSAGGHGGELMLWDIASGRRQLLLGHAGAVVQTAWSSDGALLATVGTDGSARIWDPVTGRQLAIRAGHRSSVDSVAWLDDGRIATACEDHTVRIWDVHRDPRSLDELADLVDQHVPWRLVDGRLVPADR